MTQFLLIENEYVVTYLRRHWIWFLLEVIKVFLVFVLPITILLVVRFFLLDSDTIFFGINFQKISQILSYTWAIVCFLLLADRFTKYALNFWILTNKRLIESEFPVLFSRKISTLELENVEDVTVKVDGSLATLVGYGSLYVQTAGARREFIADNVNNPEEAKQHIFETKSSIRAEDHLVKVDVLSEELAEQVAQELHMTNPDLHLNLFPSEQKKVSVTEADHVLEAFSSSSSPVYDWAHIDSLQRADTRNATESVHVAEEFKSNLDQALRTE